MSRLGKRLCWAGWASGLALLAACNAYDASLLDQQGAQQAGGSAGGAGANSGAGGGGGSMAGTSSPAGKAGQASEPDGGSSSEGSGAGAGGAPGAAGTPDAEAGAAGQTFEPLPTGEGSITHERWLDVPGSSMADFPSDAADETNTLTQFKAPATDAFDYADRISGFLVPPQDGNYRFWIACDDNGELWLSTDDTAENEVLIAWLSGLDRWSDADEWGKFASQESRLIPLEAGKRYRIEALVKQGIGGSNLSVGWLKPGQSGTAPSEVVPGSQLSP